MHCESPQVPNRQDRAGEDLATRRSQVLPPALVLPSERHTLRGKWCCSAGCVSLGQGASSCCVVYLYTTYEISTASYIIFLLFEIKMNFGCQPASLLFLVLAAHLIWLCGTYTFRLCVCTLHGCLAYVTQQSLGRDDFLRYFLGFHVKERNINILRYRKSIDAFMHDPKPLNPKPMHDCHLNCAGW